MSQAGICPIQDRENAGILLDYCDRKLDPDMMALLDSHVSQCAGCRQALAAQQLVWEALDSWDPAPVSIDFNRRLYQRIDKEAATAWWRRMFQPVLPFSMRPALPMAAACIVLMAVFLFQAPSEQQLQKKMTVEFIDVEQVEKTLDDMEMLRQMEGLLQEEPVSRRAL
ncbi:MAG: hypothetical protein JJE04_15910 [Acidobacteriia bacterium]|nr:hypothetical protein [Terriglobia bacterium]